jgi:hypothetical protein
VATISSASWRRVSTTAIRAGCHRAATDAPDVEAEDAARDRDRLAADADTIEHSAAVRIIEPHRAAFV